MSELEERFPLLGTGLITDVGEDCCVTDPPLDGFEEMVPQDVGILEEECLGHLGFSSGADSVVNGDNATPSTEEHSPDGAGGGGVVVSLEGAGDVTICPHGVVLRKKAKTDMKNKKKKFKNAHAEARYKFKGWWGRWVCFALFMGVTNIVCVSFFMAVQFLVCLYTHDLNYQFCYEDLTL